MVVRVRLEANEPRLSEQIRDALYALARNPHSARDLRNGSTGADGEQNLPAGAGLFLQLCGLLSPELVEAGERKGFLEDSTAVESRASFLTAYHYLDNKLSLDPMSGNSHTALVDHSALRLW